jgi:hypothetical protein
VYVKNHHTGSLQYSLMLANKKLEKVSQLDQLGVEEFQRLHWKRDMDDIIDNDFSVNKAKYHYYSERASSLDKMRKVKDGYKKDILSYFGIREDDEVRVGNADIEHEKLEMKKYLQTIKNTKLFKDEQERFKTVFFSLLFSPKNTNYRNRGIRSINAILEEDSIPFRLTSGKENKGTDRNKRWWAVIEVGEFTIE